MSQHKTREDTWGEEVLNLLQEFSHDGRLQTFEDRERFRSRAKELLMVEDQWSKTIRGSV